MVYGHMSVIKMAWFLKHWSADQALAKWNFQFLVSGSLHRDRNRRRSRGITIHAFEHTLAFNMTPSIVLPLSKLWFIHFEKISLFTYCRKNCVNNLIFRVLRWFCFQRTSFQIPLNENSHTGTKYFAHKPVFIFYSAKMDVTSVSNPHSYPQNWC